jgi:hypothetical protein
MWIHTLHEFMLLMWIHTLSEFILIMWILTLYEFILCWRDSLFLWSREGGKNAMVLVRAMVMSVIIILGVQTPAFGGCAWLAIMLFDMMVFMAPAAWARARARTRTRRRSGTRSTPSSGQIAGAWQRGLVIVHGLVTLFFEVIALAIILLVVGLLFLASLLLHWPWSWHQSSQ